MLGLVLLVAWAGAACTSDNGNGAQEVGRITSVEGAAQLIRNGSAAPAAVEDALLAGDSVSVGGGGRIEFRLGGEADFRLVEGRAELGSSAINLGESVVLVSSERPVEADFGSVRFSFSSGAVRVEGGNPGRVAAYDVRDLRVTAGSFRQVPIPSLWQVLVTGSGELDQARPIEFSRGDPVDAEHLAHALDVDGKLVNLLRGAEPQLVATDGSALAARLADAGIGAETLRPFPRTSRSDRLMGLAFARELNPGNLPGAFEQAMALKVLGATWGLVAQIFDVNADVLVAGLQNELTAVLFPGGPDGRLVPPPPPPPRPRPTGRPVVPAPSAPVPAPAPAPPGQPSPTPTGGLLQPVVDPLRPLLPDELEAIIDELFGLVNGLVPIV